MSQKAKFFIKFTLLYGLCCAISLGLGTVLTICVLNGAFPFGAWETAGVIVAASLFFGFALTASIYSRAQRMKADADDMNGKK